MHFPILSMRVSELTTKIRKKIDTYYQRQKCRPRTPLSGGIKFTRMFVGVPWQRGLKRSGVTKMQFLVISGAYIFGALELYSDMK